MMSLLQRIFRLSEYGFFKLEHLLEAVSDTVEVFTNDNRVKFVRLVQAIARVIMVSSWFFGRVWPGEALVKALALFYQSRHSYLKQPLGPLSGQNLLALLCFFLL